MRIAGQAVGSGFRIRFTACSRRCPAKNRHPARGIENAPPKPGSWRAAARSLDVCRFGRVCLGLGRPASSVGGTLRPGPGFFECPVFPFPAPPIRPDPEIPEDPSDDLADRAPAEIVVALIFPQALGQPAAQIVALLEILGLGFDPLLDDALDLGLLPGPAPGLERRLPLGR